MISIVKKKEVEKPVGYTRTQFLCSKRYEGVRDVLSVLLKDNTFYTVDEVDRLIEKFMKGKVK